VVVIVVGLGCGSADEGELSDELDLEPAEDSTAQVWDKYGVCQFTPYKPILNSAMTDTKAKVHVWCSTRPSAGAYQVRLQDVTGGVCVNQYPGGACDGSIAGEHNDYVSGGWTKYTPNWVHPARKHCMKSRVRLFSGGDVYTSAASSQLCL
jgi:hypothetical protein